MVNIHRPRCPLDAMIDAACGVPPVGSAPTDPATAFLAKHRNDPTHYICFCGEERKIGEKCSTPKRCAILGARARCVCSLPGAARRECGSARSLKSPCRCYCHTRLPEEREPQTPAAPSATISR